MLCFASAQAKTRKLTTKNRFIFIYWNVSFFSRNHQTPQNIFNISDFKICINLDRIKVYCCYSSTFTIQHRMSDVLARIWVYRNQSRQTLTRTRNAQHLPLLKLSSAEWSEAQSFWTEPQTSSSLTYPLSLVAHFQVIYLSSTSWEEINWSQLFIGYSPPKRYSEQGVLVVSNTEQQVV